MISINYFKNKKILKFFIMFFLILFGIKIILLDKLNNIEFLSIVMYIITCFILVDMYYPS